MTTLYIFFRSFGHRVASKKSTRGEEVTLQTRNQPVQTETIGFVYCPICTHTVEGTIVSTGKTAKVKPGQKCSRCSASLDPGYIMKLAKAA